MASPPSKQPTVGMVYDNLATFVVRDIRILESEYTVLRMPFEARPKWRLPLAFVRQFIVLLRQRGKTVWYDNEMTDCSTQAMEEGVKHSAHFLLFLSGDPQMAARASESEPESFDADVDVLIGWRHLIGTKHGSILGQRWAFWIHPQRWYS